jgi:small redox-active disulfide protein 2
MIQVKVLGTGCANCETTMKRIEEEAKKQSVDIQIEKIEELSQIMAFGVISTPGVVIDGEVVHSGSVPPIEDIKSWLTGSAPSGCCGSCGG